MSKNGRLEYNIKKFCKRTLFSIHYTKTYLFLSKTVTLKKKIRIYRVKDTYLFGK